MHLCIHGNNIPAECGSCFLKNIHDFCSQFVAEVLSKPGAVKLKKKESLYLPGQLAYSLRTVKAVLSSDTASSRFFHDSHWSFYIQTVSKANQMQVI